MEDPPSKPLLKDPNQEPNSLTRTKLLGFFICTWLISTWISSNEFTEVYQQKYHRDSPYLLTWTSIAGQVLFLPLIPIFRCLHGAPSLTDAFKEASPSFTWKAFLAHTFVSTFIWIACYYLFNYSVRFTSAASDVAIFNSAPIFGFILSVLFVNESITFTKVCASVFCFFGVGLIAFGDEEASDTHSTHLFGDAMSFASALLYASFLVHLRYFIGTPRMVTVTTYTVFMGLFTIFFYWPIFILLNKTGVEPWILPPNTEALVLFCGALIGTFLENITIYYGATFTSPLFVIIAGTLAIPFGVGTQKLLDYFNGERFQLDIIQISGLILIVLGFISLNMELPKLDSIFSCQKPRTKKRKKISSYNSLEIGSQSPTPSSKSPAHTPPSYPPPPLPTTRPPSKSRVII